MVIVIDSREPLVMLRGDAARRVVEEAENRSRAALAAAPQDEAEALRLVAAEVYDVL